MTLVSILAISCRPDPVGVHSATRLQADSDVFSNRHGKAEGWSFTAPAAGVASLSLTTSEGTHTLDLSFAPGERVGFGAQEQHGLDEHTILQVWLGLLVTRPEGALSRDGWARRVRIESPSVAITRAMPNNVEDLSDCPMVLRYDGAGGEILEIRAGVDFDRAPILRPPPAR